MDNVSKDVRAKTMGAVKCKKTGLENPVFQELRKRGFRYRTNVNTLKGKPDIAIKKYKIAIFIDSCFWHGCKSHCRMPSSNIHYWSEKIKRNKERDLNTTNYYEENGWNILRIWEHEIKYNFSEVVDTIADFIDDCRAPYITKRQTTE